MDAIREANPEFLEVSRICDELSQFIVDMEKDADVASKIDEFRQELKDFQRNLNVLSNAVNQLGTENKKVNKTLDSLKTSFNNLEQRLTFNVESESARNKKLTFVLNGLEQYLRRHS